MQKFKEFWQSNMGGLVITELAAAVWWTVFAQHLLGAVVALAGVTYLLRGMKKWLWVEQFLFVFCMTALIFGNTSELSRDTLITLGIVWTSLYLIARENYEKRMVALRTEQ